MAREPGVPRRLLGQILKEFGLVHEGMIQEALSIQREKGGRIGEILVSMQTVSPGDVVRALAAQSGLAFHDLAAVPPAQEAIAKIDLATARAFGVLPVSLQGKVLKVLKDTAALTWSMLGRGTHSAWACRDRKAAALAGDLEG